MGKPAAWALAALASLPLPGLGDASLAGASAAASASLELAVRVPRVLLLRLHDHPDWLSVEEDDLRRGEVVVRGPRIAVVSNHRHGAVLQLRLAPPAAGVTLHGLPVAVQVTGESGQAPLPPQRRAAEPPYAVEYRVRLAAGTLPGRYRWPVTLAVQEP